MTLRRSFLAAASVALAILLIALLIKVGKINLRVTLQQLRSVSLISFAKLILLTFCWFIFPVKSGGALTPPGAAPLIPLRQRPLRLP